MNPVGLQEIQQAVNGTLFGAESAALRFTGVSLDSRTIQPGEIFWAVKGEQLDGHDYLSQAEDGGAGLCIVEQGRSSQCNGLCNEVKNTTDALGEFARWYRSQHDTFVIGVTGSVGKTTTRQMIHTVLQTKHEGVASPKNFNNHFGVPLSLLNIEQTHEYAVLEMGASHSGEIRDLAKLAMPEVGVVTRIAASHLASFGSEQIIQQTKGELIEALPASGLAILNGDDPKVHELHQRANCKVIHIGEKPENDLRATHIHTKNQELSFNCQGKRYTVPVSGKHFLTSALAALAIGLEIGMTPDELSQGLRNYQPVAGRCAPEQIGGWTVLDDTYNASPASTHAAAAVVKDWQNVTQKVIVIGDMLELGEQANEFHAETGKIIAHSEPDFLVAIGKQAEALISGARDAGMSSHQVAACDNFESLQLVLNCWLEPGALILVKGSRGMKMERVLDWLRKQAVHEERTGLIFPTNSARSPLRACA